MFRKVSIAAVMTVLTVIASMGFGSIEQKLFPVQHSWGYLQQTSVVQG